MGANLLPFRYITKIVGLVLAATMLVTVSGSVATPAYAGVNATVKRAHVVNRALNQLGTKYKWAGESPRKGFDCSGLVKWAFEGEGVYLPHSSLMQYKLAGSPGFKRIRGRKNLIKGDLVFFKTSKGAKVGHVGIYMGAGKMVNSRTGGVQVDNIYDPYYWDKRYVGAVRLSF
jgi:cell wall-associated NlpC family hydrolase